MIRWTGLAVGPEAQATLDDQLAPVLPRVGDKVNSDRHVLTDEVSSRRAFSLANLIWKEF